jgi:2-oxoisovalerate dehydrogenase E1 component
LTKNLQRRFGRARVFDTLLDETTILGVAQGAAHLGLLPVPEIQYLAYLHNAVDQLRGEAASLAFFSSGQFTNPIVVRVAGLAYQKGFGGHFHNDNAIGNLRDIPGIVIATPSRGDDGARLLRGALALARACGRVVVFLEPIALYHERDLYADGDEGWLFDYPQPTGDPSDAIYLGEVGVYHEQATDLLIPTYANGVRLALRAAKRLKDEHGIEARVLDLRWLQPLPHAELERHARECKAVLVADECRATAGGIADAVVARLAESRYPGRLASARAADSFVPLGPAADLVLLSEDDIVRAALEVVA